LVVGDREVDAGEVAVRTQAGKDLGAMKVSALLSKLVDEVARRGRSGSGG
jgi:threonyl-tRNA synthetase